MHSQDIEENPNSDVNEEQQKLSLYNFKVDLVTDN